MAPCPSIGQFSNLFDPALWSHKTSDLEIKWLFASSQLWEGESIERADSALRRWLLFKVQVGYKDGYMWHHEDRNSNSVCWRKKTGVKDNFLNGISFKRYNILTQEAKRYIYDPKFLGSHCESVYNGEWRALRYDAACERLYYGDDEKYLLKPYNFHVYQFLVSTRVVKLEIVTSR